MRGQMYKYPFVLIYGHIGYFLININIITGLFNHNDYMPYMHFMVAILWGCFSKIAQCVLPEDLVLIASANSD